MHLFSIGGEISKGQVNNCLPITSVSVTHMCIICEVVNLSERLLIHTRGQE